MITSEGAKQLSANGDGLRVNYEMKPVQNIKYHFEWKQTTNMNNKRHTDQARRFY